MLGYAKERLLVFLDSLQIPFPLLIRFLVLLESSSPVTQGTSQSFLDVFLVGIFPNHFWGLYDFHLQSDIPALLYSTQ